MYNLYNCCIFSDSSPILELWGCTCLSVSQFLPPNDFPSLSLYQTLGPYTLISQFLSLCHKSDAQLLPWKNTYNHSEYILCISGHISQWSKETVLHLIFPSLLMYIHNSFHRFIRLWLFFIAATVLNFAFVQLTARAVHCFTSVKCDVSGWPKIISDLLQRYSLTSFHTVSTHHFWGFL